MKIVLLLFVACAHANVVYKTFVSHITWTAVETDFVYATKISRVRTFDPDKRQKTKTVTIVDNALCVKKNRKTKTIKKEYEVYVYTTYTLSVPLFTA
ncbi:MAG: uncharacterized protein A8A55_1294 [Amphiamblys sp. WSBS2006]|nr:MAG: uncharacterized protein A8A55_1294 [Amphiamblys sp. WSBS2006]